MNALHTLLAAAMLLVLVSACTQQEEKKKPDYAADLYRKSCALLRQYTDSVEAAGDSASLASAIENFEKKMAALNMKYPSATDMTMPDNYNDTLFMLTQKYVAAVEKKLHPEQPDTLFPDTLSPDTLSAPPPTALTSARKQVLAEDVTLQSPG